MNYDVIITNGVIVGADGEQTGDVAIRGETIAAVGPGLVAADQGHARVIDATGRYVIPGGLDVHVHLELPFCGTVSSDDWNTGTRAAAKGGVTTVIDFAIPAGTQSLVEAYETWMSRAQPKACVDYCFHMAITNWDRHGAEMKTLVEMGCPTFKEFMIYASQGWQADDRAIYNTLERCRQLGAMLLVHAESSRVLDELIARLHTPELMSRHGARLHAMTRPNFIEAEGIQPPSPGPRSPAAASISFTCPRPRGPITSRRPADGESTCTRKPARNTSFSTTRFSTEKMATSSLAAPRSRSPPIRNGSGRGSMMARSR